VVVVGGAVVVVVVVRGGFVVGVVAGGGGEVGAGVVSGTGATGCSGTGGAAGGGRGAGGGGGGGGNSPMSRRCRASGEATGKPRTGTPERPVRMRSPKIAAGKLPPVTARRCTLFIGWAGS